MEAVPTPINANKIKIPFAALQPGAFMQAFGRLTSFDKFDQQTLYRITKLAKKMAKERTMMEELRLKLINEFAAKDEKGEFVPRKDEKGKPQEGTFIIPEANQAEWSKRCEEFDKTEAEIDMWPLDVKKLHESGYPMSPQLLMVLEPILQGLDE